MRTVILTAALAFAVVPGLAFAQNEDDENSSGSDESRPEGSATIAPEKKRAPS